MTYGRFALCGHILTSAADELQYVLSEPQRCRVRRIHAGRLMSRGIRAPTVSRGWSLSHVIGHSTVYASPQTFVVYLCKTWKFSVVPNDKVVGYEGFRVMIKVSLLQVECRPGASGPKVLSQDHLCGCHCSTEPTVPRI